MSTAAIKAQRWDLRPVARMKVFLLLAFAVSLCAGQKAEPSTTKAAPSRTQPTTTPNKVQCPTFGWCATRTLSAAKLAFESLMKKAEDLTIGVEVRRSLLKPLCAMQTSSCIEAIKRCPRFVRALFEKFCDGANVNDVFKNAKPNNLGTCLATPAGKRFLSELSAAFAKAKERSKDPPSKASGKTASAEKRRKWARCAQQKGFRKYLCYLFRKYKDAKCSSDSVIVLFKSREIPVPKAEQQSCNLPKIGKLSDMCKKANPKDKKRVTVGTYGCGHVRCYGQKDLLTCQSKPADGVLVLLETDSVLISVGVQLLPGGSAIRYASIKLVFRDPDSSKEMLVVELKDDAKPLLDGKAKTVVDNKGKVKIQVTPQKNSAKIQSYFDGLQGRINLYRINGTQAAFGIILRVPDSFGQQARGLIFEGCLDNVDLTEATRQKRSTATEAGKYDAKMTGDPNAATMATEAAADIAGVEKDDAGFQKALLGSGPALGVNAILVVIALITSLL